MKQKKNKKIYLRFEVETEGKYYLSINQINKRKFPKSKGYKYSYLSFLSGQILSGKRYHYVGGGIKSDKENWVGAQLKEGICYATIDIPWRSFVNQFSFSVYGPQSVKIETINKTEMPKKFEERMIKNYISRNSSTLKFYNFNKQGY